MVKLKTFAAKDSVAQLDEDFAVWQTQNQQRHVVSLQVMPAGMAFSKPQWLLHVWHRGDKKRKDSPEAPMVSTR